MTEDATMSELEIAVLGVLVQHGSRMMPLLADARKIIDMVTAAERERCAKIVEGGSPMSTMKQTLEWLAREIRGTGK